MYCLIVVAPMTGTQFTATHIQSMNQLLKTWIDVDETHCHAHINSLFPYGGNIIQ